MSSSVQLSMRSNVAQNMNNSAALYTSKSVAQLMRDNAKLNTRKFVKLLSQVMELVVATELHLLHLGLACLPPPNL